MKDKITPELREGVRRAMLWGNGEARPSDAEIDNIIDDLIDGGWLHLGDPNKPVLRRVVFGFMVGGRVDDEGWCRLEVPTEAPALRGPAEAEHVRKVIASWSARLAEYDRSRMV